MIDSNSLQMCRYELPTCLLEVWGDRSALSEWTDRPVVMNLKWRLRIAEKSLKGNQVQLETLIDSIEDYVKDLLAKDQTPKSTHALKLPQLTGLNLTTLQLFDLCTSLELCTNEIAILPSLELEVKRITPAWLKIAAVLVATVGVTTSAVRLISPQMSPQLASSPSANTSRSPSSPANPLPTKPKVETLLPPATGITVAPLPNLNQQSREVKTANILRTDKNGIPALPAIAQTRPAPVAIAKRSAANQPTNKPTSKDESQEVKIADGLDSSSLSRDPVSSSRSANNQPVLESAPAIISSPASRQAPAQLGRVEPSLGASSEIAVYARVQVTDVKTSGKTSIDRDLTSSLNQNLGALRLPKGSKGKVLLELVIDRGKLKGITVDTQSSSLKDSDTVDLIKRSLQTWTPPTPAKGNVFIVLQVSP